MKLMEALRKDAQLQEIKKQWLERFSTHIPPYNYDEYGGIEDYKQKLLKRLENGEAEGKTYVKRLK